MNKKFKEIFFSVMIAVLIFLIIVVAKIGKFKWLEGYMYSLAAEIQGEATSCDATSSDATSCDATSSNATSCDATSSNATSCNATSSNASNIKVTNNNESKKDNSEVKENVEVNATPIKEETEEDLEYNNSEITQKALDEISNSSETQNIIINIDNKTVVSKEIFETIKGTTKQLIIKSGDNQIIFNGKDIVESKDIDATISSNSIVDDIELKEVSNKGIVLNFANKGNLPGVATIRIKVTDKIKSELNLDDIYVYYYNQENKELVKLSNKATYKEGYIEFAINHNSKYVFVNEIIKENAGTKNEEDNTVTFLESHKMYVIIIICSVFTIIFVIVILILDKKTKGKANKEQ